MVNKNHMTALRRCEVIQERSSTNSFFTPSIVKMTAHGTGENDSQEKSNIRVDWSKATGMSLSSVKNHRLLLLTTAAHLSGEHMREKSFLKL